MTRFRNIKLGVFRQYQNKNYFKNEQYWEKPFEETFESPKILIK